MLRLALTRDAEPSTQDVARVAVGKQILIGIDLGTTVLKAAAFDGRSGKTLATSSRRLPIRSDTDGTREQDPAAIDKALRAVFGELRSQLGYNWNAIGGIGLAAQGGSAVICDRATGQSLSPMFLWNDMRFQKYFPDIQAKKPLEYWRKLSWRDEPGWGLAKITWLRDTQPKLINTARNIYAGAGDYVYFHLTGQWRQDAGNALQEGCFNVSERRLDADPLALVDVDLSFVSPFRQGHETHRVTASAGKRLGLPEGVPVAGPYMDHEVGYLSAATLSDRPLQFSLGTAWVGNFVLPPDAKWSSPFQLVVPSPTDEGWLVVQPLLTGNVTWDWAMAQFTHEDRRKAIAMLPDIFARNLLPRDGLMALPWLNMPNPLWQGSIGGGTLFGVGAATDKHDLLRAVAASMVYETARIFADVKASGLVDAAILSGGASKGAFFQQLLAAALAPLPVRVLTEEDWSGARGAIYAFSAKAAKTTAVKVKAPTGKVMSAFQKGAERYNDLFTRLYGHVQAGGPVRFA